MRAADAAAGRQPLGDIQNLLPRFTASVPAAGTQLVDGQENLPPSLSAMSPLLPPRPRAAPPAGPQATQPGASLLQRLLQLRQPDGSQSDQPLVPPAMPWAAPAGSGQRRGRLSSLQASRRRRAAAGGSSPRLHRAAWSKPLSVKGRNAASVAPTRVQRARAQTRFHSARSLGAPHPV